MLETVFPLKGRCGDTGIEDNTISITARDVIGGAPVLAITAVTEKDF